MTQTVRQIKGAIQRVATTGKKLDELVHGTAIECMRHAESTGDATLLADLCNAMPKGSRVLGLVKWAVDHTPMLLTHTAEGYKGKLRKQRTPEDWKITEAEQVPFWDYSKETEPTLLTAEQAIGRVMGMLTRLQKDIENGKVESDDEAKVIDFVTKLQAVAS